MPRKIQGYLQERRDFLITAASGIAALALPELALRTVMADDAHGIARTPRAVVQRLVITEVLVEMIDLTQVYMLAFEDPLHGPMIPGPLITATTGDPVELTIENRLTREHQFAIPGVVSARAVAPGQSLTIRFLAPAAGTYMYLDPSNAPIHRVLGLHGALIVLPRTITSPYSDPTPAVKQLFDDLGTTPRFPGRRWVPERSHVWVFNSIDPDLNERYRNGNLRPDDFIERFRPEYFTLNGKTGFFAAHEEGGHGDHRGQRSLTIAAGRVGEPALIRTMNAGMSTNSPHIHGTHVYVVAEDGNPTQNAILVDTWSLPPLKRKDMLHPFIVPPDIPASAWPPREERFPLVYPMHCHIEPSQTARGGNYPQGIVTHWSLTGPHQET